VVGFSEGTAEMRALLGNKGANLAEMTQVLGPERVPGGFTITTAACVRYQEGEGEMPEGLDGLIRDALATLEQESGKKLGDPDDPLLVSVRSGAPGRPSRTRSATSCSTRRAKTWSPVSAIRRTSMTSSAGCRTCTPS